MSEDRAESRWHLGAPARPDLVVERGTGSRVKTAGGERYLDLLSGRGTCPVGHAHPALRRALREQADRILTTPAGLASGARTDAARAVCETLLPGGGRVLLTGSGAGALRAAVALARRATGRRPVAVLEGAAHGWPEIPRPLGEEPRGGPALADLEPTVLPEGDLSGVDEATAAVLVDPVRAAAGVRPLDAEGFRALRERCAAVGALLVVDESLTFARTEGGWLARPVGDLTVVGAAIGSGVPSGAVLVSRGLDDRLGEAPVAGADPLTCAAVRATLEVLDAERAIEEAGETAARIREALAGVGPVRGVRGTGRVLGLEMDRAAARVVDHLLEERIIAGSTRERETVLLLPDAGVGRREIDRLASALDRLPPFIA